MFYYPREPGGEPSNAECSTVVSRGAAFGAPDGAIPNVCSLEQWVQDHNWRSEGRAGPGRAKKKNAEPKCEDCMVKIAHFRLEAGPRRWCPGCAQAHPGAVVRRLASLCEDCNMKASNFGVRIGERVERRWCGACAKAHEGARGLAKAGEK